jgi:hypothetical protein
MLEEQGAIERLRALFDDAEDAIKAVEPTHGLHVPAVNQLRYAGHHLLRYLGSGGQDTEEMTKAQRHCQRAMYDAYDAQIQSLLNDISDFQADFRHTVIVDIYPSYKELTAAKKEALDFLGSGHGNHDGRADMYQALKDHLERLRTLTADLPMAREELKKRAAAGRFGAIMEWARVLIGGAVGAGLAWYFSL